MIFYINEITREKKVQELEVKHIAKVHHTPISSLGGFNVQMYKCQKRFGTVKF